jgi:hypothetical protein
MQCQAVVDGSGSTEVVPWLGKRGGWEGQEICSGGSGAGMAYGSHDGAEAQLHNGAVGASVATGVLICVRKSAGWRR